MKETTMTCITCPLGCAVSVTQDDQGEILSITGNTCKRGEAYVRAELTHPVRVLTSTVRVANREGRFCPVKTDRPISKDKLFEAMKVVNAQAVHAPVAIGDVIVENFMDECNLVATAPIE